jgi:hypothetical protein
MKIILSNLNYFQIKLLHIEKLNLINKIKLSKNQYIRNILLNEKFLDKHL